MFESLGVQGTAVSMLLETQPLKSQNPEPLEPLSPTIPLGNGSFATSGPGRRRPCDRGSGCGIHRISTSFI